MSSEEIEELIRSYQGPQPRSETKAAVMDVARGAKRRREPAATLEPVALPPRRKRRGLKLLLSAAAALLLAAGGICWFSAGDRPMALGKSLRGGLAVERGGRSLVVHKDEALFAGDHLSAPEGGLLALDDGSTVKLDKGTRLQLTLPGEGRRADLRLKDGRILLRVSGAPGEFAVTGSARVTVLGTVFGVEEKNGGTSVGVLEGRVRLSSAGGALELTRGKSGRAAASGLPEITAADPNATLRWARERKIFHDRPLSEVLDWISDNSSYRFEVKNVRRIERTVTLTVGHEPMLKLIEKVLGNCDIKYAVAGQDVTIK
jgi:ferric-dicitrate binding protein FerR (iron transport regulator)